MSDKPRWPREDALRVAHELAAALAPACERLLICGSLRRGKATVGDVEIVYIPRRVMIVPSGEIFPRLSNLADFVIGGQLYAALLAKRPSIKGTFAWGEKNKLAVHVATGIPVDLFTATAENWWSYIVCRTGPAESNIAIASAAQRRGWKWNPYGEGFSRPGVEPGEREIHAVASEREVFEFVGLPYLEPEARR